MKSLEKLQYAEKILWEKYKQNNDTETVGLAIALIHEFIVDNEPVKKGAMSVWEFANKEKPEKSMRPILCHVFHDEEHKVAVCTDAHIMFANPAEYNEKFAGKIIDKYGKKVEGKYPNWHGVIPADKDVQPLEIRSDLQDARNIAKSTLKMKGDKNTIALICLNKELDVWVSEKYVDLFIRAGIDGWSCKKDSPKQGALVKKWDDGRILLVMPMMGPEEKDAESYDKTNMIAFRIG